MLLEVLSIAFSVYKAANKKKETRHEGDKLIGKETMGDWSFHV
jgi:hypothetical protein